VSTISISTSSRASYGDYFSFVTCITLLVFKRCLQQISVSSKLNRPKQEPQKKKLRAPNPTTLAISTQKVPPGCSLYNSITIVLFY